MSFGDRPLAIFRPASEVSLILSTLRNSPVSWMADEIEATIQRGKVVEKEYIEIRGRKPSVGSETVPLTSDEQLQIALETIKNYFVVLYDAWIQAQNELPQLLTDRSLQITIAEGDESVSVRPFSDQYEQERSRLDELITKLVQVVESEHDHGA